MSRPVASRGHNTKTWGGTLNNYEDADWDMLRVLPYDRTDIQYMCMGKEVGQQGTPHIQLYIRFIRQLRMATLKKIDRRISWDAKTAGDLVNKKYCSKDEGKPHYEFFEWGTITGSDKGKAGGEAMKKKWAKVKQLAQEGKIDEIDGQVFVCHYTTLKKIKADYAKPEPRINDPLPQRFIWIWGKPGCGKSSWVREFATQCGVDLYTKNINKWWCEYERQPFTIIDDFSKEDAKSVGSKFKNWFDHYAFKGEVKGSSTDIRPQFIFVTSNYQIAACNWPDETTIDAVTRRFTEIECDREDAYKDITFQAFCHDLIDRVNANEYVIDWKKRKAESEIPLADAVQFSPDDEEHGIELNSDDDDRGSAVLDDDIEPENNPFVAESDDESVDPWVYTGPTQVIVGDQTVDLSTQEYESE